MQYHPRMTDLPPDVYPRIRALEAQVAQLMSHLGIAAPARPPPGWGAPGAVAAPGAMGMPADIVELVRRGDKIEAIKRYREITGVGLREAKDAIDAIG